MISDLFMLVIWIAIFIGGYIIGLKGYPMNFVIKDIILNKMVLEKRIKELEGKKK